jgi:enediyne biosynthesis protein E4
MLSVDGCRGRRSATQPATSASPGTPATSPVRFTDVADSLGVRFKHTNGESGRLYLAETMGAGCAFLDYDGDGRLDLFLVNSSRLPGFKDKGPFYPALYHQRSDGTFEDVTKKAGLAIDCYGMGIAAGDYDNDGHPDIYLTAYGGSHLFHNNGNGTFSDVTRRAGTPGPAWGTSAAWFDYDRDGSLDLFVGNYCRWTPKLNHSCGDSSGPYICGPKYYTGTSSVLYHNDRDGRFTDVTRRAGVGVPNGKALGALPWDFDGDGWPDLVVANDTVPNWLFHNNRNGTFSEVGVEMGVAYARSGQARAGMGVDTADYENSGREALLIGNNSTEGLGLYRAEPATPDSGGAHLLDVAEEAGIVQPSLPYSTFGALFVDADLDGYPDIITANGQENEHIGHTGGKVTFAEPLQLFHNEPGERSGTRHFREVGRTAGALARRQVWRGLAVGDFDGDGDPDLLVTANNGRAALLRNDGANRNNWLAIRPRGVNSNRDGLGTRVVLQVADRKQSAWVRSGSSYCSDSEHVARFGLGPATQAEIVELHWASGGVQTLRHVKANQLLQVTEAVR